MNAPAPTSFTSHLLSTDKREWSITVEGIPFVIERSPYTDKQSGAWQHRGRIVETVDTWTLYVVTTNGWRELVGCTTGMRLSHAPGETPRAEFCTQRVLKATIEAARTFAEGLKRLTVMADELMGNVSDKAPLKIRKLRQAAVAELAQREVLTQDDGRTVSLVCGDAVLIVSKQYDGEWNRRRWLYASEYDAPAAEPNHSSKLWHKDRSIANVTQRKPSARWDWQD